MKKTLVFILAFLVLAFSIMPCADGLARGNETEKYSIAQSTSQNEPHDDACSPFCICTCCAGFSINGTAIHLSSFLVYNRINHYPFILAPTFSIASSIWQPPQLV